MEEDIEIADTEIEEFLKTYFEEDKEDISEELTFVQRLARARQMSRLAPKLAMKRKLFAHRRATPEKLERRARKAAIAFLRKKFGGKRGEEYKSLSPSEKIQVDKLIEKKKSMIGKIAKKMLRIVRKADAEKFKAKTVNESFEEFMKVREAKEIISEAEYKGRKVALNKPFDNGPDPGQKTVYVKDGEKVKKVTFGDENMENRSDNPKARKSFRARHKCDTNPGPKTKARYWACKDWQMKESNNK